MVATIVFYQLSVAVFEGASGTWAHRDAYLGIWLAVGLLAFVFWVATVVPLKLSGDLSRGAKNVACVSMLLALSASCVGKAAYQLWPAFARGTMWLVGVFLSGFYSTVTRPEDYVIETGTFGVYIAPKCSGIEGIGLISVFLLCFLWWFRHELRFPRALGLLPIGIASIWLANSVRIAILVAIGSSISPEIALAGFHNQSGWIAFNVIALCLVAVALSSPIISKTCSRGEPFAVSGSNPAAPYLVPFLVLTAATMLTAAFSASAFDRIYPVRVLAVVAALVYFRSTYRQSRILQWTWSWQAVLIGITIFAFWMLLMPRGSAYYSIQADGAAGLAALSSTAAAIWLLCRSIGSIFTVPIAEELAFRGFLARRLIAEDFDSVPMGKFTWLSFLISSALFGILHHNWIAGGIAGMLLAAAFYRRKCLSDAVLAHVTANLLITGYVLLTKDWAAWS